MATKLKSKYMTAFVRVLLIICAALVLLLAIEIPKKRDYIYGNPFFQGDLFYSVQVHFAVHDIAKYYVEYGEDEKKIEMEKKKVSEETVQQWREEFEALALDRMTPEREDQPLMASEGVPLYTLQEKEFAEWSKQFENAWQRYLLENTTKYIEERKSDYHNLKNTIARLDPLVKYTIKDKKNHKTYTNRTAGPDGELKTEQDSETTHTITFPLQQPIEQLRLLDNYLKQNQLEGSFTFYATVEPNMAFKTEAVAFKDYITLIGIRKQLHYEFAGFAAGSAVLIVLFVYMRKNREKEKIWGGTLTTAWQRLPIDIRMLVLLLFLITVFGYGSTIYDWRIPFSFAYRWVLLAALLSFIGIGLNDALRLYRTKGAFGEQWKKGYILTLNKLLKAALANKILLLKSVLIFLSTVLLGLFLFAAWKESGIWPILSFMYALAYLFIAVPYLAKRVGTLNHMLTGMNEISAGRFNFAFEENGTGELSQMVRQLQSMKQGFQAALDVELRSERLKSELITNVSHDLKTPLTSMINYVDLLKKESPLPGESDHYVQVLEKKTNRLKMLIEDLFEVSQLSSGTVVLDLETVNVSALLQQALAELNDKIETSKLHFRVHIEHPHIFARLDGKKTWRVFENLIQNALHYSMPETRVHLSLTEEQEHIVLRISNVSAYEIQFDAEELFERFKRGDSSRHTEGSGLGLAIAKSIVELQGGRLLIAIEGDYFKVTVIFNKQAEDC